jgi:hypothetical protein
VIRVISRPNLVGLLAHALGAEKAEDAVTSACTVAGLSSPDLTQDEALRVLEHIAKTPGLVGITARFAKSRVLLQAPL